jgi:hypothetical protein
MRHVLPNRLTVVFALTTILAIGACTDATGPLPRRPASELRTAPTSVAVAGKTLLLESYLWRDFMPVAPPNGTSLMVVLRVKTSDGSTVPTSVTADGAWVVFEEDVWATEVEEEFPRDIVAPNYEVVARGGPKWGPGVSVDVVVRLRHEGREHLLRVADQPIRRTD